MSPPPKIVARPLSAQSATRAAGAATRRGESWFSIATAIVLVVLAACAVAATVQAYGPIFTPPLNGP